jgi:hypothetical protein
MQTTDCTTPSCTGQNTAAQLSVQATSTQLAVASDSRSLDLDLVTEEGDTVTLSLDARASAIYAAFGDIEMDGDGLSAQWTEMRAGQFERELSLTVEGDLNRQELREIRRVIKTITEMMNQFVQGNLNSMAAGAGKLEGLETIDSLEVSMSYERQVAVIEQEQSGVSYDRTGQAVAETATDTTAARSVRLVADARSLAEKMAREVTASTAPTGRIMESAERMFRAHRRRAGRMGAMGGRIMDHIRDRFKAAVYGADRRFR